MNTIKVHDKYFVPLLLRGEIEEKIAAIGQRICEDYKDLNPLFIAILNGSFIFAADLFRHIDVRAEISFIKLASYKGTTSTGHVVTAIGMEENIFQRHVILVEDIVDTGKTLSAFIPELVQRGAASIKIASFLTKPEALKYDVKPDYVCFEIPNKFVVGYGLDYDGQGRNLADLYQLSEG